MANIKEIKNRIGSVSFTKQITKAMKMVAAAKLRRTQNLAIPVHFYYDKLKDILNNIYSDIYNGIFNIYVKDRGSENILLVVVSSDKGLCGAFNSILFRKVMNYIKNLSCKKLEILPIGKKGLKFFQNKNLNVINNYVSLFGNLNFKNSSDVSTFLISQFQNSHYNKVNIFYNKFINSVVKEPTLIQFLPINSFVLKENNTDYIYEPFIGFISENIVLSYLKIKLHSLFLSSLMSEHSSRMIAMGKATDNATDLLKDLKVTYNRSRQSAITTEMLEIISGAEALS